MCVAKTWSISAIDCRTVHKTISRYLLTVDCCSRMIRVTRDLVFHTFMCIVSDTDQGEVSRFIDLVA